MADLYVESGKFTEAEAQYQQAMKKAPDDIRVLLGYAMLKDQMHQPQEALKFYQQAEQKHPKQPSVYNDLAVHYARWDMVPEAIEAAQRAVDLRPREPRYRNNLAALLVEAGMPQEAFKQLREVYDEPVAHYDLGFLLNKRGMKAAALQEFTIALQLSPRMASARQWVERLSRERARAVPAAIGMMPPRGPAPGAVRPNPSFQGEEASAAADGAVATAPAASPQYACRRRYSLPSSPTARPGAVSGLKIHHPFNEYPVPVQYPAQTQYPAQIQYPPQSAGPQYTVAPPYRNAVPASPPGGQSIATVAARVFAGQRLPGSLSFRERGRGEGRPTCADRGPSPSPSRR